MPLVANEAAVAPDTVAALHNFYQQKRRALPRVLLMTGGLFALTIFIQNTFADEPQNLSGSLVPFYIGVLGVSALGTEALYYRQYSKRSERWAIEEFRAHQLRSSTREQLKPEYFKPESPRR
ncbi:hypothetical protein FNT36_17360 [Hymenobacter setariae]|uniref:DUF4231 domain-containing protein n=1 Tax=Hymenobacter setariae TaxID=2594794 RepID=A0A558BSF1_9BACT|nr:hypothetical protein FNT36_17360 [Hymenobacter setariae]